VAGIGPAKLSKIRPYLDFSGGMPLELRRKAPRGGMHSSERGESPPGGTSPDSAVGSGLRRPVDLNRASSKELHTLPGIGPALADRILESRMKDGPFRASDDLLRVPGIGPSTLSRIRNLVIPSG
jgi:competence ComEA-like helix-hairpin-helix protein